jgi:hypothetical protein
VLVVVCNILFCGEDAEKLKGNQFSVCCMGCTCVIKVKVTLEQATRAQRGSRYIALLFNLCTGWWVGGQRHAPAALPTGKARYPLYRRLGGPQGPVWTGVENLAPTGIWSPDRPACSELLYRLSYHGPRKRLHIVNILLVIKLTKTRARIKIFKRNWSCVC